MKKTGALKGKAGPSKPASKSGTKPMLLPKVASQSALLYHFHKGVIRTCEVPGLRFEKHAQTFPKHRCGFANNKLYLLDTGNDWVNAADSLRFNGVLQVYDPYRRLVEQSVKTCACNTHEVPLLIRGQELLDLGTCSRVLKITSGQREAISSLNELGDFVNYGACQVLNKLVYIAGGDPFVDRYADEEEPLPLEFAIWTINWVGFKATRVGVWPDIKLKDASIVHLSASEFLVTGTLLDESGTAAFRLRGNTLSREGGSSKVLGRCSSSCVQGSFLYMLYDSGLVKCDLGTGLMRVYDLAKYERLKCFLWGLQHTPVKKLSPGLFREICAFS